MNRRTFTLTTGAALLASYIPASWAQGWPDKPIKLILSQPAGSGADSMARMIGDQLSRRLNQPIVVENRPGGQNAIGAQAAARSAADGYTFYFATAAALVMNSYLFKNLPYDPRKDFVPVGMVGTVPFTISVNASGSYLTKYEVAVAPTAPLVDRRNIIFNPLKFKARTSVTWDHGPFSTRMTWNHVNGYTNNVPTIPQEVSSFNPIDLAVTVTIGDEGASGFVDKGLTFGFEVRNLFDEAPPYVNITPSGNGSGGYDATAADPIGRLFAINVRKSF